MNESDNMDDMDAMDIPDSAPETEETGETIETSETEADKANPFEASDEDIDQYLDSHERSWSNAFDAWNDTDGG